MSILATMSADTTTGTDPWAGFWPSFIGGVAGATLAALVTLVVHFLTSRQALRRERAEVLDRLFDACTEVAKLSMEHKEQDAMLAMFRAGDLRLRLARTTLAGTKTMTAWSLARIIVLFQYDNVGAISASRTSLSSMLNKWARNPWSWFTWKSMRDTMTPMSAGTPRFPVLSETEQPKS